MLLRVEEEHEVGLELLRGAGARVVELRREGPDAAQRVRAHLQAVKTRGTALCGSNLKRSKRTAVVTDSEKNKISRYHKNHTT